MKFSCHHCEYEARYKGNLNPHIRSVHENIKFICRYCEYEATKKGNLKAHIQPVHEGIKFSCPHCEYEAAKKYKVNQHIQSPKNLFQKILGSYQPLNTPDIIIIEKKFLPLSPHFLQPPPHGRGDPPAAILLDVGHTEPSPRGRHHQGVVGHLETQEMKSRKL